MKNYLTTLLGLAVATSTLSLVNGEMIKLSSDTSFQYETLRILAHARYAGSDVGEVLTAAHSIVPGNLTSFSKAFHHLADTSRARAANFNATSQPVAVRDAFFAASNYYRAADYYLHGNWDDPLITSLWPSQTATFDKALSLMPVPGRRISLQADGFTVPAIFYTVDKPGSTKRRPTLIVGNGYDGAQEEMLHVVGLAALERGWNVMTYEGPGQPTVRRDQKLGFITEWEKVVSPVVDFLECQPEVDESRLAIFGYSMGGWLAARAAAFDHRIGAVVAVDGVYSVGDSYINQLREGDADILKLYESGQKDKFDDAIRMVLANPKAPTQFRWGIEQGLWSFKTKSTYDYIKHCEEMTLKGIAHKVKVPVFIGNAEDDIFFAGQPEKMKHALDSLATLHNFTTAQGAGEHCQVGAAALMNSVVFNWLEGIF